MELRFRFIFQFKNKKNYHQYSPGACFGIVTLDSNRCCGFPITLRFFDPSSDTPDVKVVVGAAIDSVVVAARPPPAPVGVAVLPNFETVSRSRPPPGCADCEMLIVVGYPQI